MVKMIIIAVCLLLGIMLLPFLALGGRFLLVSSRVDLVKVAAVDWLPVGSEIYVRGTKASLYFCGRSTSAEVDIWARTHKLPKVDRPLWRAIDVSRAPPDWNGIGDLRQQEHMLESGSDWITYERREDDGGGVTLHFDPSAQRFYGSKALW